MKQLGSNSFVFTSDQGNSVTSNGTIFANVVSGTMQWNKQNGTDFPVALAQDALDGTSKVLGVAGFANIGISVAGALFSFSPLSADQIAAYPQTISTQSWTSYHYSNEPGYTQQLFQGYGKVPQ